MLIYILGLFVVGLVGSGLYYYKLKKQHRYKIENVPLHLPDFDDLMLDFEEDDIQNKISNM